METGEQPANPLLDRRDALVEELLRSIAQEVRFYGTLSADTQREVAVRLVNLYLASLSGDLTEASRAWGDDPFARRHQHGAPLADALSVTIAVLLDWRGPATPAASAPPGAPLPPAPVPPTSSALSSTCTSRIP